MTQTSNKTLTNEVCNGHNMHLVMKPFGSICPQLHALFTQPNESDSYCMCKLTFIAK